MTGVHRLRLSCVPGGMFFLSALTDHLLTFSALPHMVPSESICAVDFVDSRQACDGASSRYRQDPARLIIAPDMQSGRERNTKMAAACSVCLHVATSDASTSWWEGRPEKYIFFFLITFLPLFGHRKSNRSFCCRSPSLCRSSFLSLSLLLHALLLCPSVFNKGWVIGWNNSSPGPIWPLHHNVNEPRWWDDHTEVGEAQNWSEICSYFLYIFILNVFIYLFIIYGFWFGFN